MESIHRNHIEEVIIYDEGSKRYWFYQVLYDNHGKMRVLVSLGPILTTWLSKAQP